MFGPSRTVRTSTQRIRASRSPPSNEAPRGLSFEDAAALGVVKTRGIELYSATTGRWDLVCRLEDLAPGKWVRLLDRSGAPVAFELCMMPEGLYVRWDDVSSPTQQAWWPPGYGTPNWSGGWP